MAARNSSFFDGNSRKIYGCEMPIRRAIASVEVPSSPWMANSARAARRISSRRSSAVRRDSAGLARAAPDAIVSDYSLTKPPRSRAGGAGRHLLGLHQQDQAAAPIPARHDGALHPAAEFSAAPVGGLDRQRGPAIFAGQ